MTIHQTAIAERINADMRKLLPNHPRSIEVIYAKAILPATDSNNEKVGNLDYLAAATDWEPVTTITMLEASEDIAAQFLADFSDITDGEMEAPLVVSLSEDAPEQSVITVIELSKGKIVETSYMILKRQAIGRNGAGGTLYSLIPFRDQDEEIDAAIDQKTTEIETAEGIAPTPEPTAKGVVWG